jgi:hypothetical protein
MERADLIEQVLMLHAIRWEHREDELRRNYIEAKQRGNTQEAARLASELLQHQRWRNDITWGLELDDELAKIQ